MTCIYQNIFYAHQLLIQFHLLTNHFTIKSSYKQNQISEYKQRLSPQIILSLVLV